MANARELKDALKDALSKTGALSEIRARMRAEVFNVLKDENEAPPPLSNENLVINELIREYLIFNGYNYTESVLLAETGQPPFDFDREFLQQQLLVKPLKDAKEVPLLYGLVSYFSKANRTSGSAATHSPPSKLKEPKL